MSLRVVCEFTHRFPKITGSVNAANLTIREQMPETLPVYFPESLCERGYRFNQEKGKKSKADYYLFCKKKFFYLLCLSVFHSIVGKLQEVDTLC